ncbi:MAG TPA: cytochrome C, partial [Burkholderiales bacterium]|nr:cytochrome C [Burkholderiales bacterium]
SAGRPASAAVSAIAGMPKSEFVARMNAFRAGTRPATVMHQIAKGYDAREIELLAAWFAALPKEAR